MTQFLSSLTSSAPFLTVIVAIAGAGLGLWLAAAWWTFADLSRRVRSPLAAMLAPVWILASTPVLLPFALATYLLVRPQETVAARRSRRILGALVPSMAEDAMCSGCGTRAEEGWRRCPSCTTWLTAACSRCGQWSSVEHEICPYCATDRTAAPTMTDVPGLVPALAGEGAAYGAVGALPADEAVAEDARLVGSRRNREARDGRRTGRAATVSGPGLARIGR